MIEFVMILGRMSFQASIIIMVVLLVRKLFDLWKVSKKIHHVVMDDSIFEFGYTLEN